MKIIHAFAAISLLISTTGCLSTSEGESSDVASTETVRAPVETDCRTLGYEALRSLVNDVMQIPSSAMLYNSQTMEQFLTTNQDVLGGTGVSENRSCSIMYFKAVSQLGMLSCHYLSENIANIMFPNGIADVGTAYAMLTSKNIDTIEQDALTTLAAQITTFDGTVHTSLERKKISAVCSSIFASIATQAL